MVHITQFLEGNIFSFVLLMVLSALALGDPTYNIFKLYEENSDIDIDFTYDQSAAEFNVINLNISAENSTFSNVCNLIQSEITNITGPIIVFDLTNSNQMIDSTQDVVKYLKLPAISYEYCTNDFQCNIYQFGSKPSSTILYIVRAFVLRFRIDNVAIFYDHTLDFKDAYNLLENTNASHCIRNIDDEMNIGLQVEKLREKQTNLQYFKKNFLWIFVVTDQDYAHHIGLINEFRARLINCADNITMYVVIPQQIVSGTDFYFNVLEQRLSNLSALDDYSLPLMSSNDVCSEPIDDEQFNDNEYIINSNNKDEAEYRILKLINFEIVNETVWSYSDKDALINDISVHKVTKCYRIATVLQAPFIMKNNDSNKYEGYSIYVIDEIAKRLDFTYEIIYERNTFGNVDENDNWDGVVRQLIDRKVDIGLGSMSVVADRESVIDFTVPYYDLVGIAIMMRNIPPEISMFRFLKVLETNVWLCIIAAFFCTSLIMWLFDRLSPYSYQNNQEKFRDDPEKRLFSFKECLWFCMTSLTPQGGGAVPKCYSAKLVAATWWLFGFIIVASYTANLAAFFTKTRLETQIESLDDLDKQYKYSYAPVIDSAEMKFFKRMKDIEQKFYEHWKDISLNDSLTTYERSQYAVWEYPVGTKYTKLWEAMERATFPKSKEDAIERVLNSTQFRGFAYLGDATDIKYWTSKDSRLEMIGEEFSRKPYAIGVQQGSPLKKEFDEVLLELLSTRQLEDKKKEMWMKKRKAIDRFDGIQIEHIYGFFIVIICGIAMSIVALIFEYLWFRHRHRVVNVVTNEIPKLKIVQKVERLKMKSDVITETTYPTGAMKRNRVRNRNKNEQRVDESIVI